jgi:hypothetical protein
MQIGGQTDVCELHKAEAGDFRKLVQARDRLPPKGLYRTVGEFSSVTRQGQMTVDGHSGHRRRNSR